MGHIGVSPRIPMWFTYFRSKATLERLLAVERCRREMLDVENADLRARLTRTELEFARLRDAALMKHGAIPAPLRTEPAPTHPLVGVIANLGVSQYTPKPFSEPAMPDA
jgi:hypothetical protein